MRLLAIAFVLSVTSGPSALADEPLEASTLDAVRALATRNYENPAAAVVRNVGKSLARNGLGYCGEVSLPDGSGFTVFHAILGENGAKGSVLRMAEFPETDQSPNAMAVRQMMKNVGCLE